MTARVAPRAAGRAAAALARLASCAGFAAFATMALASAGARAGSLTVRDANGAWTVNEDPREDANDYLLRRLVDGTRPDERFGRNGQTAFSLSVTNEAPASVRVDAARRIWMVGATLVGNTPQPIVARFLADGQPDVRWGVQGRLAVTAPGLALRPNDLLPLADGSVLVAGETTGGGVPHAVVFHLEADGSIDRRFGNGGAWQRGGESEASSATSLAAGADGTVVATVAARGAQPVGELWSLSDAAPALLQSVLQDDRGDGEDLRAEWAVDHWVVSNTGGPTAIVPAALLTGHAGARAANAASAASDPGEGGFNPFATEAASAPAAAGDDAGVPWTLVAFAVLVLAGVVGTLALRARAKKAAQRPPPRR